MRHFSFPALALIATLVTAPLAAYAQAPTTPEPAAKPLTPITAPSVPKPDVQAPATTKAAEQLESIKDEQMRPASPLIADAPLATDFILGNKNAKVVMIEYSSLTCPHCAHFHNKMLPDIQKQYIDTGKIMFIMRPYPLNEAALKASVLIDCIGQTQSAERYYTFARVLFDQQSKWAFEGNYLDALQTFASVGGVNKEMFDQCIANPEREIKILNIKKAANDDLKIPHTPYFFIDGKRYEGERTVEGFSRAIDEAIRNAR